MYILALQTNNSGVKKVIKESSLRKYMKNVIEVNINFFVFLDGAYEVNRLGLRDGTEGTEGDDR